MFARASPSRINPPSPPSDANLRHRVSQQRMGSSETALDSQSRSGLKVRVPRLAMPSPSPAPAVGSAVHDSELYFRLLVDSIKDYAIFLLDPKGTVVSWNEGAERIKQYSRAEIVGQSFSTFYSTEDVAAGRPQRELQIAGEQGRFED